MKKVIALCLILVLVLTVTSLCLAGGMHCNRCGKNNASIINNKTTYSYANIYVHNVTASRQIYCPDCHSSYWETYYAGQENHCNPTHYHQMIGPNLSYEYDICGACGGAYDSYTRVIH